MFQLYWYVQRLTMTPTEGSDWKILSTSWKSMTSRCLKDISPCSSSQTPKSDHLMSSQMDDEEMENFMRLADENGEISKHDLIIQVIVNPIQLRSKPKMEKLKWKSKIFSIAKQYFFSQKPVWCTWTELNQTAHNLFQSHQTKQSSFWSGHLDLKNAPCSHSTKVKLSKFCLLWIKDVYFLSAVIVVCFKLLWSF